MLWKLEIFLCSIFLFLIPFLGPDLRSYREQLSIIRGGELDYSKVFGQYGPLVYPGGHVLSFLFMSWFGGDQYSPFAFQVWFTFFYLLSVWLVIKNYETAKYPKWISLVCCLSVRIHAIFITGCFNDGLQVMFSHLAVYYFLRKQFMLGCVAHSLSVSVKMSAFLYSPGILLVLLMNLGITDTLKHLLLGCAAPQLLLGAPFLLSHPWSYLKGAFDFSRSFDIVESWNWNFLPNSVFVSGWFSLALLLLTLSFQTAVFRKILAQKWLSYEAKTLEILHASSFIGVVFLRSMHRQFFVMGAWLYPGLASKLPQPWGWVVLFVLEFWINNFEPSSIGSVSILACHLVLLFALLRRDAHLVRFNE